MNKSDYLVPMTKDMERVLATSKFKTGTLIISNNFLYALAMGRKDSILDYLELHTQGTPMDWWEDNEIQSNDAAIRSGTGTVFSVYFLNSGHEAWFATFLDEPVTYIFLEIEKEFAPDINIPDESIPF